MKAAIIRKNFIGMFFMISIPNWALAIEGQPLCNIVANHITINRNQSDTIPPPKKSTPANLVANDKPVRKIIKVVPKARRQPIPIPVKVKVKPVKIIKPKIIKPVIKILH